MTKRRVKIPVSLSHLHAIAVLLLAIGVASPNTVLAQRAILGEQSSGVAEPSPSNQQQKVNELQQEKARTSSMNVSEMNVEMMNEGNSSRVDETQISAEPGGRCTMMFRLW
eukprot:gene11022-13036_t